MERVTEQIAEFLNRIGIRCEPGAIPAETLLPGIHLEAGGLRFDPARLAYPGDLLHEAGHVATALPADRSAMAGKLESTPAEEMAAIAWSYAACVHLGLEPTVVFHSDGYKGGSESLLSSYETEQPVGVPLLAWYGMTTIAAGGEEPTECFWPRMRSWLREAVDQ